MKIVKGKKVYVGLSGGVDSSVSAALLKQQGYDVTGVFIKVWHPDFLKCDWKSEMRDAMRVCARLDIPFKRLDLEDEYRKEVVEYMIEEYGKGRTPNPDVMCNRHIKFGGFWDFAKRDGADFIATGHYAQCAEVLLGENLRAASESKSTYRLLTSADTEKDQTYFLWTLTQEDLEHVLFPIGHLKKSEVRELAEKFGLFTAEKKDSQGLCFMGHVDMKEFLKKYLTVEQGDLLNRDGEVIGTHDGALLYTLSERHGFTLTKKTPDDLPYYVIAKDIENNTVTVDHHKDVTQSADDTNMIINLELLNIIPKVSNDTLELEAKIRYRGESRDGILKPNNGANTTEATFTFNEPHEPIAAGQSLVFYKNSECFGGGIVK